MKKRKVYILYGSGQKNLQLLDNTKEYLKEMGKEKNFDFDFICRETLQKAEEKFEEDMKTSFDMAFFNLSLNKDDINV